MGEVADSQHDYRLSPRAEEGVDREIRVLSFVKLWGTIIAVDVCARC